MFQYNFTNGDDCYTFVMFNEPMENMGAFDDSFYQSIKSGNESSIASSSQLTTKMGVKRNHKGGTYVAKFWDDISRLVASVESRHTFDLREVTL